MVEYSGLVGLAFVVFATSCVILYGSFMLYMAARRREQEAQRLHGKTAQYMEKFVAFEEKWAVETEERIDGQGNT